MSSSNSSVCFLFSSRHHLECEFSGLWSHEDSSFSRPWTRKIFLWPRFWRENDQPIKMLSFRKFLTCHSLQTLGMACLSIVNVWIIIKWWRMFDLLVCNFAFTSKMQCFIFFLTNLHASNLEAVCAKIWGFKATSYSKTNSFIVLLASKTVYANSNCLWAVGDIDFFEHLNATNQANQKKPIEVYHGILVKYVAHMIVGHFSAFKRFIFVHFDLRMQPRPAVFKSLGFLIFHYPRSIKRMSWSFHGIVWCLFCICDIKIAQNGQLESRRLSTKFQSQCKSCLNSHSIWFRLENIFLGNGHTRFGLPRHLCQPRQASSGKIASAGSENSYYGHFQEYTILVVTI